jgi:hypothetical protein
MLANIAPLTRLRLDGINANENDDNRRNVGG